MKFSFVPMMVAGSLLPSLVTANDPALGDQWFLNDDPGFTYSEKKFSLTYKFSDAILSGQTKATLYLYQSDEKNCAEGEGPTFTNGYDFDDANAALSLNEGTVAAVDGETDYTIKKQQTVVVTMDPDNLSSDGNEGVFVGTDATATVIKFCVRFGLYTTGLGTEVNFLESLVSLTANLQDGFTVSAFDVKPKDKLVRTANQTYKLDAYRCSGKNSSNEGFVNADLAGTYRQGDVIKVCVEPDAEALKDNIFMKEINSFTYTKDGGPTQAAVPDTVGLTESGTCTGHKTCLIETILFATFYSSEGTVSGSGSATMQFGSSRRLLRDGGRAVQQAEDQTSEFDLSFDISNDDSFNDNSFSGATSSMSILALVGSAAAALLL